MITTYLDKSCRVLNSSVNLELNENNSALWFCVEKGSDLAGFLDHMTFVFGSLAGYFWLAFSGGTGSHKILEFKRSFGHWSIPKKDVVLKYDSLDENGNELYSDIAQINSANTEALAALLSRSLFGVDSSLFFLPPSTPLTAKNLTKPLADLLVKRNSMGVIDENLLNIGLVEKFVEKIVSMNGVGTVTIRDSNMSTMVVAIGRQLNMSQIGNLIEKRAHSFAWKHVTNEQKFSKILSNGVGVSIFS